jgi:hypothetical protein
MADNGWMYSGRISATEKTAEWVSKTDLLVKELAHGSKSGVRPSCPCTRCNRRHRQGKDDMTKHLWLHGFMPNYVTSVDFSQYDYDRGEVMQQ